MAENACKSPLTEAEMEVSGEVSMLPKKMNAWNCPMVSVPSIIIFPPIRHSAMNGKFPPREPRGIRKPETNLDLA